MRRDLPELYAAIDVFALPSIQEGSPNALMEAMAAGKPVLASRAEGVAELLGECANDQTAEFGDAERMRSLLRALLRDDGMRRRLGAENRRRAETRFSLGSVVGAYADLFVKVAEKRVR